MASHGAAALPAVPKPDRFRFLGPVEIAPIADVLGKLPEQHWAEQTQRRENNFKVFDATQHIVLLFTMGNQDPRRVRRNPGWEFWKPVLKPVMDRIAAQYGYAKPTYCKAMFARLAAGRQIRRHRDGAGSNPRCHKIHVPIRTNPDAVMWIDGESRHLPVGEAVEVNNIVKHAGRNDGDADRVHFIFELYDAAAAPVFDPEARAAAAQGADAPS